MSHRPNNHLFICIEALADRSACPFCLSLGNKRLFWLNTALKWPEKHWYAGKPACKNRVHPSSQKGCPYIHAIFYNKPLFGPFRPLKVLFLHPYLFFKHGPYMGASVYMLLRPLNSKLRSQVTSVAFGSLICHFF